VCRRRKLNVSALYNSNGEYGFTNGFSYVAIIAFLLGVLPSLPGFLVTVHQLDPANVPAGLVGLFNYAWFVGFALAFAIYLVLRKAAPKL
jgi:NCS1 family nucleobase:cation symporter-1